MERKDLLEGEEIVTQSDKSLITLTNYRIRYSDMSWNQGKFVSIMLEKVSSLEIHSSRNRFYLLLTVVSVGLAFLAMVERVAEGVMVGMVLGIVFALLFFFSKKYLLTIASDGGAAINFHIKGMKKEKVIEFINKIEREKDRRVKNLTNEINI